MDLLSLPTSNHLMLVIAPYAARTAMLDLAAQLAAHGPLRVLDGGNQFNVYPVARSIRRHTPNLNAALQRIYLSRAFTCYQMAVMLDEAAATPIPPIPTLALDLLATFYDENVTLVESQRLLRGCLRQLQRMSQQVPVIVSVRPPAPICQERIVLLEQLRQATTHVWEIQELTPPDEEKKHGENPTLNYPGLY
jgi:phage tail sheath gpL-like